MLKIRKAVPEDFERILEIYACAREVMKNSGNPDQWGDFQPPRELVEYDISVSRAYVMEEEKIHGVFVIIEGDDPLYLTELCVRLAVKLLGRAIPLRRDKRYPTVFEYLGWCSWDALQIRVSERGLVEKCEELKKKDIPIKWAIIDDMWAEVSEFPGKYRTRKDMFALMHSSHLYDYEAAKDRFPMGLSHAIE